jgi:hypothetical protein
MSSTPLRNLSRRTKVYWKDYEHWSCGRHLPALVLPANIERCWLCTNKRPSMETRPAKPEGFEPNQPRPKTKRAAKRIAQRRKPSELDAMLTGSVAPSMDVEIAPKPTTRPAPSRAPTQRTAPAVKTTTKASPSLVVPGGTHGVKCAWNGCEEIARPRSKYCSRNCSNKNARARHKARDK